MGNARKPQGGGGASGRGGGWVSLEVIEKAIRQVRTSVRSHPGVLPPDKEKALLNLLDQMEASIHELCPVQPKGMYFVPGQYE